MTTLSGHEAERQTNLGRRGFLTMAGGTLAATGLAGLDAVPALAAEGRPNPSSPAQLRVVYTMPSLVFDDPATQRMLGTAYESALTNLVGINSVYADPPTYDGHHTVRITLDNR